MTDNTPFQTPNPSGPRRPGATTPAPGGPQRPTTAVVAPVKPGKPQKVKPQSKAKAPARVKAKPQAKPQTATGDKQGFVEKYLPTFSRQGAKKAKAGKPLPGAPKVVSGKKTNLNTSGKVAKPKLPIVNLLPPRLELAKIRRSTRRGFVIFGIIIVVSAGLVYLGQQGLSLSALNDLAAANTGLAQANASLQKYSSVKSYYATIAARQQAITKAQGNVINYQSVYSTVFDSLPAGATISSISVTNLSAPATGTAGSSSTTICGGQADPLAPTSTSTAIGCLNFTGSVVNRGDIATLGISLKNSSLFSNATVVQTGGPSGGQASSGGGFKGSAVITVAATAANK